MAKKYLISAALILLLPIQGCTTFIGALSVAGSGVLLNEVFKRWSDRLNVTISRAAEAGSMVSTKATRDAQIVVETARAQFHDEMNSQWDKLDREKLSAILEVDKIVDQANNSLHFGAIKLDETVLDVDQTLDRISFLRSTPSVRRIENATQYYKDRGIYDVTLRGSLFTPNKYNYEITVGDQTAKDWIVKTPPYDVRVEIPLAALEGRFKEDKLSYVPLKITAMLPRKRPWYKFLQKDPPPLKAEFIFTLELLPIYPAVYKMTGYNQTFQPDLSQTKREDGQKFIVGGCGHDGCNEWHEYCEGLTTSGVPFAPTNFLDDMNGAWGNWEPQKTRILTGKICSTFYQHSQDRARTVSFDVLYHPLIAGTQEYDIELKPQVIQSTPTGKRGNTPDTTEQARAASDVVAAATRTVCMSILGHFAGVCAKTAPVADSPSTSCNDARIPQEALPNNGVARQNRLRYGRWYEARFKNEYQSFTLLVSTFTGDELAITPAHNEKKIEVTSLQDQNGFKSIMFKIDPPW